MSLFARLFGTRTPADVEARIIPVLQMMAIDGRIDGKEQLALEVHLDQLGISRDRAKQLLASARTGTDIPLPQKLEHQIELLTVAALVMAIDGDVAPKELAYLYFLAGRMGLPASVVQGAIDGALQMAQDENPGKDMQSDFAAARAALVMVALVHLRQS